MSDSKPIHFKPLSDGLGFHPKLGPRPQAPSVPKLTPPPITSAPTPPKSRAPATPSHRNQSRTSPTQHVAPVPEIRGESLQVSESRVLFLMKRTLAFGFDILFHSALFFAGLAGSLLFMGVSEDQIMPFLMTLETALFVTFAIWMILIAQESIFRMTLGKRLFGLFLDGSPLAVVLRGLIFPLSFILGGVGVLIAIFDRRSRTLHDLLTGVRVIEIARI